MAACRRMGSDSAGGSRSANARSIRVCQELNWSANARRLTSLQPRCRSRAAARGLYCGKRDAHAVDSLALGIEHRQVGCHWTRESRTPQRRSQRLERMADGVRNGGALEAAVGHAVIAARVTAHAVALPLGLLHQGAESGGIPLVGEQIARPLPTEDVVGRIAPGRALVSLIAGQEVEEQPGMIERPAPLYGTRAATPEDLAEQALAGVAGQKDILPWCVMVAIPG